MPVRINEAEARRGPLVRRRQTTQIAQSNKPEKCISAALRREGSCCLVATERSPAALATLSIHSVPGVVNIHTTQEEPLAANSRWGAPRDCRRYGQRDRPHQQASTCLTAKSRWLIAHLCERRVLCRCNAVRAARVPLLSQVQVALHSHGAVRLVAKYGRLIVQHVLQHGAQHLAAAQAGGGIYCARISRRAAL